jgi:outer membrane protein with beta-barrel domain
MSAVFFFAVIFASQSSAQEVPRVEIGVHVTTLNLGDFKLKVPDLSKSERGVGGRVSVNFTNSVALEAEYNIFPSNFRITVPQLNQLITRRLTGDRVTQFLFGIKAGTHWDRFGLFAKIRPGFVSTNVKDETINPNPTLNSLFRTSSGVALDFGGVFEFYPTRHTMFRLDASDMIIRYETKSITGSSATTTENRKLTGHNLQLSVGVGLRF